MRMAEEAWEEAQEVVLHQWKTINGTWLTRMQIFPSRPIRNSSNLK
jgi:hypothetical protein